jgi:formate hydrogenlyase subunit 3/multisubunit Na+/H+ antiporter MnhD subunit
MNALAFTALVTHPLALPVAVPFAAGALCLVVPRSADRVRAALALLGVVLTLALAWPLFLAAAETGEVGLRVGGRLWLGADGLSAFFLLALSAFALLIAIYSAGHMRGHARHRAFFAFLLWTLAAGCGAVLARDLLVLLVFWGVLALGLYLMIGLAGPGAAQTARKSLLIVGGADALLVLGVVLLWTLNGTTRMDAGPVSVIGFPAHIAFLAFVAAAFAKAGAVPLHAWVPDCCEKAPIPVTALLPGALDKLLGIYLLIRCIKDIFLAHAEILTVMMLLGAVTVLAGGLMALIQRDLKRLLGYSCVSQVGYIVLGVASGTPLGFAAAIFHALNNAVYKSCLFLCAGAVEKAAGTADLDRLGGLAKAMPVTFAACLVASLSIAGIPPLNGFTSKWMIYHGILATASEGGAGWIVWLTAAMLGSALTLAAMVKLLHATFLCKPSPEIARRPPPEAGWLMTSPMIALAGACVAFGVFAQALPLDLLIFGAVEAELPGVWWSGTATVLILVAVGLGAVVCRLAAGANRLRPSETYIGGERIEDVYIRGEAPGSSRHVEVTGAEFYDTLARLPGVRRLYTLIGGMLFDIYELAAASATYLVTVLRSAHSGALALYLIWIVAGLLVLVYALAQTVVLK